MIHLSPGFFSNVKLHFAPMVMVTFINHFSTGQDDRLNAKEDRMTMGKEDWSKERGKEWDEESNRHGQGKEHSAEEATSLPRSESLAQQKLKYCHSSGKHTILSLFSIFVSFIREDCKEERPLGFYIPGLVFLGVCVTFELGIFAIPYLHTNIMNHALTSDFGFMILKLLIMFLCIKSFKADTVI